ncbi:NAD(P)-dependent dehydrogenase (short-subunit alcohol dehydrogenase family) [Streptomyces aurantiacus]|uniref:oxidoreductase n=1 Tax=Streptomyces aurantiacus TaxID=47760 RepID=UPI0027932E7F|nr:oxidoreductase [Streptomyces aurantiacus]MDQ0777160.1 NAD(P)-dependent dehydrogenase (short-subunit alcohol dehydrogenase family) [Streptomyces aurantiacus]
MLSDNSTWLITGCSAGLGRALARHVLEQGRRVIVTARDTSSLGAVVAGHEDRALVAALDVTDSRQISEVVRQADGFGGVDVLVNNAGYGYLCAVEEGEEAEVRALFETNFFGMLAMTRAVLPCMRERGRGHVVNISSIGGLTTSPAVGYYHATKFALEGLTETLGKEIAPFGLGATIVEPGAFRTDFRGRSMRQSSIRLPEYASTAGATRDTVLASHGIQENDPRLGAAAIFEAVTSPEPPVRLLLGVDALQKAREQLRSMNEEFDTWEKLTSSTQFPDTAK